MEAIDLGVSVKWGSCNLGANSPEEYGDYYAWGELDYKDDYNITHTIGMSSKDLIERGILDKDNLALKYDVAYVNLEEEWRLPTIKEAIELVENTEIISSNDRVLELISKINGNSIIFPLAGFKNNKDCFCIGESSYCWTSTSWGEFAAYSIHLGEYYCAVDYNYRSFGLSIRPVYIN